MTWADFPDFYRMSGSSQLVFKIQLPMAFPSLSAWFVGQGSLLKTTELIYLFLFLSSRSWTRSFRKWQVRMQLNFWNEKFIQKMLSIFLKSLCRIIIKINHQFWISWCLFFLCYYCKVLMEEISSFVNNCLLQIITDWEKFVKCLLIVRVFFCEVGVGFL